MLKFCFLSLKFLLLILVFSSLSACVKEKNTAYFLQNPEEIGPTYEKCSSKLGGKTSKECVALFQSVPIFKSYLLELLNNRRLFGLNLMRDEIKLTELQKTYHQSLKNKDQKMSSLLKSAVQEQNLRVQSKLALLRLVYKIQ